MRIWTIVAIVAAILTSPAKAQDASFVRYAQPVIAITHAQLVDGTGAPPARDMTIVIRDGRIAAVGRSGRVRVPADATEIDGTGKTVLPGFVFMHEHMFYPAGELHFNEMLQSFPRLYLAGGVTTARTAGTLAPYADLNLRDAIAAGAAIGPDLHVTGPFVENRGLPVLKVHGLADADEAERFVNYWSDAGVTSFKAYMMLTRAQLGRAIETAHRRGARVTGHLCSITYREAATLGIDNLEHGFGVMTDFIEGKQPDICPFERLGTLLDGVDPASPQVRALIDFLVARNVAITSTLVPYEDLTPGRPRLSAAARATMTAEAQRTYDGTQQALLALDARQAAANFAKMMRLERMFVAAGGILLAGSDPTGTGGVIPGFASQRQIQLLVEAGFPFEQAVRIGTLNGATFLGRQREIGSIAQGKRADLILIDGDPVADRAAMDRISIVFKAGIGYDRQALLNSVRGLVGAR